MKRIKFLILIIGVGLTGLILTTQVNAQEKTGISISPVTFELTANPGDVLTNNIKVYNPTDSVIGMKMEVEDFTVVGEMGEVRIKPSETETYSLARWITAEPAEFILEPKEQKFVSFTINVPENAEPGGHYGSILATTKGIVSEGLSGTSVTQKVGALVLLTVSGEAKEELIVKDFSCSFFSEYGPIKFSMRFENTGTVHVRPKGFVTIVDWQGKKAADVAFPQNNVIPGAIRKIETSWDKKWLAGRYTATLIGNYGTANIPINPVVVTFWVIPWKISLAVLLVLIIIIIFFYKTRRRWGAAVRILVKGEK